MHAQPHSRAKVGEVKDAGHASAHMRTRALAKVEVLMGKQRELEAVQRSRREEGAEGPEEVLMGALAGGITLAALPSGSSYCLLSNKPTAKPSPPLHSTPQSRKSSFRVHGCAFSVKPLPKHKHASRLDEALKCLTFLQSVKTKGTRAS